MTTYATWNPSDKGTNCALSNANLTASTPANSSVRATLGASSGKWYWEVTRNAGYDAIVGVGTASATLYAAGASAWPGTDANGWGYYGNDGSKIHSGSGVAYGAPFGSGDIIGVALDMDAGTLTFYKNGVSQGVAYTGIAGTVYPMFGGSTNTGSGGSYSVGTANFGATAFAYTVPSGFNAGMFLPSASATGFSSTAFGTPKMGRTQPASGFSSTQFGTASISPAHAVGFSSTQIGSPRLLTVVGQASAIAPTTNFGTGALIPTTVGFLATKFGAARIFPMHAVGWCSTGLGTPTGTQFWRAHSALPFVRFGTPTTPTNRSFQASGFSSTSIPEPGAVRMLPAGSGLITFARSLRSTAFGTPRASYLQQGQASGFSSTAIGTPGSVQQAHASAISETAFGTPTLKQTQRAHGFASAVCGTPTLVLTAYAFGMAPRTRFGTPRQWALHQAYGFTCARFGQPTGLRRFNYHAQGLCSTSFGTAGMKQTHRAGAIAANTLFGTPLLRRNPQC